MITVEKVIESVKQEQQEQQQQAYNAVPIVEQPKVWYKNWKVLAGIGIGVIATIFIVKKMRSNGIKNSNGV
jgi:hypothetical protein